MILLNTESEPKQTVSQAEVEDSRKNRKRTQRKRNNDSKSNEVTHDCLDGNSSKISPTAKDASFESCIDASSLTNCEKVHCHTVLASENISLKMDSVMSECGAELFQGKEKQIVKRNGLKNIGRGDDSLRKTSFVTGGPSDTTLVLNSEANPTTAASQMEVEVEGSGIKKKRKRQRKKRSMDTEGNRIQPNCLDGNNSNITPIRNDASLQSCIDVGSLTESEKISSHDALTSENISLNMDLATTECSAERCQGKETEKHNEKPNGLQNDDIGDVCLQKISPVTECAAEFCHGKAKKKQNEKPSGLQKNNLSDDCLQKPSIGTDKALDIMLDLNPQSNQTTVASQVKVEGSTKKRNRNRNRKRNKSSKYLESKEVQADLLDSNSSKITPTGNDASFESCVESEKISSHVALTSENICLNMDPVIRVCSAEFCQGHEKENKKPDSSPYNNTGDGCLQEASLVTEKLSGTVLLNLGSDPTKTASHVEEEGLKKERKRKQKKRSTDLESNKVMPGCLDGKSSKTTSVERDASVGSCVDVSSLTDSGKMSSNIVLTSPQKKKRKKKQKNCNNDVKVDEIDLNCLDIDASKSTPPKKGASSESCVDLNLLTNSEKVTSHVKLTSPQGKKRKKRRKSGKDVPKGDDKVCEASECTYKDLLLENDSCLQKLELEEPDTTGTGGKNNQRTVNSVSCSDCGPPTRGSLKSGEANKKVEEMKNSSLSLTRDDLNLTVEKEENNLQLLRTSPANTKVGCAKKILLILDLNGLLVDIVANPPNGRRRDKTIANKAVFKRPFCDNFLQFCFERFNVGVWSSRTKKNVDSVIEFVMGEYKQKLLFRWGQSRCTETGFMTVDNKYKPLVFKELKKLWDKVDPDLPWKKGEYNESNTLLIDDSPYKALRNPPNTAIFPHPYQFMNAEDRALGPGGDLRVYLEGLASADNVQRYVEQNPFGQQAIGERDSSWEFYSRVMGAN